MSLLNFQTLSVEYNQIPEGKSALIELLESQGYIYYMDYIRPLTNDLIFVKEEVLQNSHTPRPQLPILNYNHSIVWAMRAKIQMNELPV